MSKKFEELSKKVIDQRQQFLIKNYVQKIKNLYVVKGYVNFSKNLILIEEVLKETEELKFKYDKEKKLLLYKLIEKIADILLNTNKGRLSRKYKFDDDLGYRKFFFEQFDKNETPLHFDKIFDIAHNFEKFNSEKTRVEIEGTAENSDLLYTKISAELIRAGMVDRAVEVAHTITLEKFKYPVLMDICNHLVSDKAVMNNKPLAVKLFNKLPKHFVEVNDQAQLFKNTISDKHPVI